ncbi:MAG TPA: hypothetical protein VFX65_01000 [Candidatus Limnocylindrales bacterium]|nr:hypothetical protein [Candidatus Limnocylindrales bacterium]
MVARSRMIGTLVAALLFVAACSAGASVAPTTTLPPALPAGAYTSNVFRPPVTVTLPDGWLIAGDTIDYFAVRPVTTDVLGIHVFRSPRPALQDSDCPLAAAPDVGTSAREIVDWIRARPGLVTSEPVTVTRGGLAGLQVDLAIVGGWSASCPFAEGLPTVPLFVSAAPDGYRWVVAGGERLRLEVLDVPGDGTIVVDIDDFNGSLMDEFLPAATPIVESLRFGLS